MRRGQKIALGCALIVLVPVAVLGLLVVNYVRAPQPAWSVAWSPDGKLLAASYGGFGNSGYIPIQQDQDTNVRLWNTDRLGDSPTLLRGHKHRAIGLAFSPDSQLLASGEEFGQVLLWDVRNLSKPPATLSVGDDFQAGSESLAFSPDGRWLAGTGGLYNGIGLWEMRPPSHMLIALAHPNVPSTDFFYQYDVNWSPDSKQIVAAASDGQVRFWDSGAPGTAPTILPGTSAAVFDIALAHEDRWLAGTYKESALAVWDLHQPGVDPVVVQGAWGQARGVTFSPDGILLAAWTDTQVLLWDRGNLKAAPTLFGNNGGRVQAVAFSPDSKRFATASYDGNVRIWNVSGGGGDSRILPR